MTLHTRVMVTSEGIDPRAAFDKMRALIGADDSYRWWQSPDPDSHNAYRRTMGIGLHMEADQGLPALMWVDVLDGQAETCDEDCDQDCDGRYHEPAGWVEINYDTAYGYRADNGASCGDLHAWITHEVGSWLTEQGATWRWYDESGTGWDTSNDDLSSLGDPEVGRPGSTVPREGREDGRRAFGQLVTTLIAQEATRDHS